MTRTERPSDDWPLSAPPRRRYRTWRPDLDDLGRELDERLVELEDAMDRLRRQADEPGRDLADGHTYRWVRLSVDRVLDTCSAIDEQQPDDPDLTRRASVAKIAASSDGMRAKLLVAKHDFEQATLGRPVDSPSGPGEPRPAAR